MILLFSFICFQFILKFFPEPKIAFSLLRVISFNIRYQPSAFTYFSSSLSSLSLSSTSSFTSSETPSSSSFSSFSSSATSQCFFSFINRFSFYLNNLYVEQYVWKEEDDSKPFVTVEYLDTKDVFIKTKFLFKSNEDEEIEKDEGGSEKPKMDEELFKKFYIWLRNIYLLSCPFYPCSLSSSTSSATSNSMSSSSIPLFYPQSPLKIKTSAAKKKKKEKEEKDKLIILWELHVEKEFMKLIRPDLDFNPTFKKEWIKE